jgi:hypothetical protein
MSSAVSDANPSRPLNHNRNVKAKCAKKTKAATDRNVALGCVSRIGAVI